MSNDASQAFRSSLKTQEPGGFLDGSARSHLFQSSVFLNLFQDVCTIFAKFDFPPLSGAAHWTSDLHQRRPFKIQKMLSAFRFSEFSHFSLCRTNTL
jgi:hypothetical protein